jgi:hypothetical protein
MNRRTLGLAAVILLAGCQASSPASSSPKRPSPGAAASPTPIVSTSAVPSRSPAALASGPEIRVAVVGDKPVIVRGDGPPNRVAVLPGATAVDIDGSIVAFLVWFGSERGDQVVTLARSADGRAWSLDSDPIYTDLGMTLSPPGPIPGAALRAPDGTWLLYGWAAAPAARSSFSTWLATAVAPHGPWTATPGQDRVLPPGATGAWDDETAAASSVVASGAGFAMWYEGQRSGRTIRGGIGYASSADGLTWERYDGPVIGPGDCGPATAAAALEPQVWSRGDGFLMLFGGHAGPESQTEVLGATSEDGIRWSCTGKVLLRTSDIPGSEGIHTIQGATLGGEPVLLVESLTGGGSEIWLATVSAGP